MDDSLTPDDQLRLQAMTGLHREWVAAEATREAAEASRLAAQVRAAALVATGRLRVRQVCAVFGCSEVTWHRWCRVYGLRELAADVLAEVDQALRAAGADESTTLDDVAADADLSLALGRAGVWQR